MLAGVTRVFQRYLIPGVLVSIYHLLRSRALVSPSTRIQCTSKVQFGRQTVVKAYAVVQTTGGEIRFGRECALSSFDHFSTGEGDIIVGDYVRFAPNCTVVGGTKSVAARDKRIVDQPEVQSNGISIGDDVLIGAGTVILPNTQISRGAVIGAGSVVQGEVPEYAIMAGSPAKVIGHRH
jgi:acetyltransferase-like isoleucine patch superfamily enzyme